MGLFSSDDEMLARTGRNVINGLLQRPAGLAAFQEITRDPKVAAAVNDLMSANAAIDQQGF